MDRLLSDDGPKIDRPDLDTDGDAPTPVVERTTRSLLDELRSLYVCLNAGSARQADSLAKAHDLIRTARLTLGGGDAVALLNRRVPGLRSGGLADWQLKAVDALVMRNLEERPSVVELAAAVRLSVSHFSRTFRLTCGMSPMEYMTYTRIEAARLLLLHEDLSLREIALRCGFTDQSHFCRVFRAATGRAPKQWRQEHSLGAPRG